MKEPAPPVGRPRLRWGEVCAIVGFLAANVCVPLIWGDVFPFTSSPMFRDSPQTFSEYRVFTPDGGELPAEDFLLQRIYDGNPPGYGVGIQPPKTLAVFGVNATEDEIRAHVAARFPPQGPAYVEIERDVIGAIDAYRCGVTRTDRFRIARPESAP